MRDILKLKKCLDLLADDYGVRYLDTDPAGLVHRYSSPYDIEIAGFIVSVLAYGNAVQIRKSADRVLQLTGTSPADFVCNISTKKALKTFQGFKHRWTSGEDIAFLFTVLGGIMNGYGSVGDFIKTLYDPREKTIAGVMTKLSEWIKSRYDDEFRLNSKSRDISYLIPSPAVGSACKRLAMYFRWMVRGPDGVDFGLWNFISPAQLVIPVDSHIARMGKLLGLSDRKTPDWKMAVEITESLRLIDPEDPVRYDFALVRPGILGECTSGGPGNCSQCVLSDVCLEAS